ncbi:MAG: cupredoxin domain-containing protein [Patescibacteria group bacterium]
MKKTILLLMIMVLFTGCGIAFKDDAANKIKDDVTNKVSDVVNDKIGEGIQQGTEAVVDTAKSEITSELTAETITISSDKMDPESITVLKGREIKLKLKSGDDKTHGFYLPDFEITETVKADDTKSVSFTPNKEGTFSYSCNINCTGIVSGNLEVK